MVLKKYDITQPVLEVAAIFQEDQKKLADVERIYMQLCLDSTANIVTCFKQEEVDKSCNVPALAELSR